MHLLALGPFLVQTRLFFAPGRKALFCLVGQYLAEMASCCCCRPADRADPAHLWGWVLSSSQWEPLSGIWLTGPTVFLCLYCSGVDFSSPHWPISQLGKPSTTLGIPFLGNLDSIFSPSRLPFPQEHPSLYPGSPSPLDPSLSRSTPCSAGGLLCKHVLLHQSTGSSEKELDPQALKIWSTNAC